MNIDDVKQVVIPDGSLFKAMFEHQLELAEKYKDIERQNGFWFPDSPTMSIENNQLQHWLKGMFWRSVEEIAEAFESVEDSGFDALYEWEKVFEHRADIRHFFEEMADALHFLIEATLYAGVSHDRIDDVWKEAQACQAGPRNVSDLKRIAFSFIAGMGLAANCLKNKTWKLTQVQTDQKKFRLKLGEAWFDFARIWVMLGCSLEQVYVLYMKKNLVNQFRQRSRY
jgi:hypothetical protein